MSLPALFAVIQRRKYNHALSKIQTCDPIFWMTQDDICLILHGHWSARHVCEGFKL